MAFSWIALLAKQLLGTRRMKPRRGAQFRRRLHVEPLEDRLVPAPFIVRTTDDNGSNQNPIVHSLRQAVNFVNGGFNDGIEFNIPGGGKQTVNVSKVALPPLVSPATIDGSTVAGQTITISPNPGNPPPDGSVGLTLARTATSSADNSQILGLRIDNFRGDGILLNNVGNVNIGFKSLSHM